LSTLVPTPPPLQGQITTEVLGREGNILVTDEPAQNPIKEGQKPQLYNR